MYVWIGIVWTKTKQLDVTVCPYHCRIIVLVFDDVWAGAGIYLAHLLLILSLTWPFLFSFSQKPNMNMACLLIYISLLRKINQTMYIQTMYYSTNFNIIIQHLLSKIRRRYQNHTPYPFPILVNSRQSHHRRGCIIIQLRNHPFGRRRWNESSFDRLRILKMWWIKRVRMGKRKNESDVIYIVCVVECVSLECSTS